MKLSVLYICTDWSTIEGSSASLLNLIASVRNEVNPIVLLPHDGKVAHRFASMGIRTIIHPFYTFGGERKRLITAIHHPSRTQTYHYFFDNYECSLYVLKQLCDTPIDIVHSNTTLTNVGLLLSHQLHAKHVWHVREYLPALVDIYGGVNRLKKQIISADAIIFISHPLKNKWNIQTSHSFVIHDAVRRSNFLHITTKKQKYLLFCAAQISPFKGPELAIRAFAFSAAHKNGYLLRFVGECDELYRSELMSLAESLGCQDSIEWVNYCEDVSQYFANATAFLMCSKFEGLGRVTAEAMFYGCPVIALATGGTLDLVKQGETGWLFNTIEECAQLINQVCKEDQSDLIMQAQCFANQNLLEEVYASKILQIYEDELNCQ